MKVSTIKNISIFSCLITLLLFLFFNCSKEEEYSRSEIELIKNSKKNDILAKTVVKHGPIEYKNGKVGGEWVSSLSSDPKTFNTLTARDADSRTVIDVLYEPLVNYDPYKKEFIPNLASFEIKVDESNDKLDVYYKLRDDLYWTTPDDKVKVKITSDDAVFWYDEIDGEKNLQLPSYSGQFIIMRDGTEKRITIEKIDDLNFVFHYPRIIANPILSSNTIFGPKFIFEKIKKEEGIEGLLNAFSVDSDVKKIPSCGKFHIWEYEVGLRVVLKRNKNHFKKDSNGTSHPYIETILYKIVPDDNTKFLLFKNGSLDSHTVRPYELEEIVSKNSGNYDVYNGGASLGASFITFNQNPKNKNKKFYKWFTNKKFRQAMSCMFNRDRVISQVYRGLAEPAIYFFAKANPFFDENIKQEFTFNPDRAILLLKEMGCYIGSDGFIYDSDKVKIEFDINCGADNQIASDIISIFVDDLADIGIVAKLKPIDFQKLVDELIKTYDWQAVLVSLSSNYWPTGGINVWQSSGNFHLWYPLQTKPATEWEARIDYLYNEGAFTVDSKKAKIIWDEYQKILLDEVPLIYTVYTYSFWAAKNRWENVYYDTLSGNEMEYFYLK